MQLIAFDWETFYSREFSLSRLSTEQYVRHELFEPIGFSIKLVDHFDHPASWCTGDKAYLQKRLNEIDWSQVALLAHNTVFDGFILSHHFGIQPALYLDTLSMGRALHGTEVGGSLRSLSQFYNLGEKGNEVLNALGKRRLDFTPAELAAYGAYCCNDTELTAGLFQKMVGRFPADEIQFIDLTIRMFCDPQLVLDRPILEENLVTTRRKKQELMAKWQQMLGCTAVEFKAKLMSNPQFADMLRQCGVEPPAKISPRTGQTTYALAKSDEGFKALLDHAHPAVQALCAARVGAKSTLEETRTENLIAMSQRGAVPVLLKYYGAHTGRYGGGDGMNWQNLPRKSKINYAVQAPPKYILTGADSSSIEARMNVWNAGQQDVVDLYLNKEDVYKHMAASIYNKPVHLINDAERFVGKQVVLGCFGTDTQVLTRRGWIRIVEVQAGDDLWDGVEWVQHRGVIFQGVKSTLEMAGVHSTPDHNVLCGTQWKPMQCLVHDANTRSQALITGAANLPSQGILSTISAVASQPSWLDAIVPKMNTWWMSTILKVSKVGGAINAQKWRQQIPEKNIGAMKLSSRILTTAVDCLIASLAVLVGVIRPPVRLITHTVVVASTFMHRGAQIARRFCATCLPLRGGISPNWNWTVSTSMPGMSQTIYGLSQKPKTPKINARSIHYNSESLNSNVKMPTYDIAYAGPRNRYTILSDSGPLIVHNCGYGMGKDKFQRMLRTFNIDMALDECDRIIKVYRARNWCVKNFWTQCGEVLKALEQGLSGLQFGKNGMFTLERGGILMPNGMRIRYPNVRYERLEDGGKPELVYDFRRGTKMFPKRIYSMLLTENLIQGAAFAVIKYQMLLVAKRYKIPLNIHDAIIALAREEEAEEAQAYLLDCMHQVPDWARGAPIAAEGKFGLSLGDL